MALGVFTDLRKRKNRAQSVRGMLTVLLFGWLKANSFRPVDLHDIGFVDGDLHKAEIQLFCRIIVKILSSNFVQNCFEVRPVLAGWYVVDPRFPD